MNNKQTAPILPDDVFEMNFKIWKDALMSCVSRNLVTLTKRPIRTNEFTLTFKGVNDVFDFYSPLFDEIETPKEVLEKFPMATVITEYIRYLDYDADMNEYDRCYHALRGLLEANKDVPCADQKPNELYITLDGHSWLYFDTDATNLPDAKAEFYRATESIGLNTDNLVVYRAVLRRKADSMELDA